MMAKAMVLVKMVWHQSRGLTYEENRLKVLQRALDGVPFEYESIVCLLVDEISMRFLSG